MQEILRRSPGHLQFMRRLLPVQTKAGFICATRRVMLALHLESARFLGGQIFHERSRLRFDLSCDFPKDKYWNPLRMLTLTWTSILGIQSGNK